MACFYVGKGTFAGGNSALTVDVPAAYLQNDLLLILAESENQTIATPSGWSHVTNSPQSTGTAAAAGAVQLAVFYKIAGASESSVTVGDSGDHTTAIMLAFRGVDTSTPFNITAGGVDASTTSSLSCPSVTTTVDNCLIVNCIGLDKDLADTDTLSSVANSNLSYAYEMHDQTIATGDGGGVAALIGRKISAGSTGNTTATGDTSTTHAYLTIALQPATADILLGEYPYALTTDATYKTNGQTFTAPSTDYKLTDVWFYISRGTAATGSPNVTARLYAHSGTYGSSGIPATALGSPLSTSDTKTFSSLSTTATWVKFTFSTPYTLTASTNYCIAVSLDSDATATLNTGLDTTLRLHSGNRFWDNSGWSYATTSDIAFVAVGATAGTANYKTLTANLSAASSIARQSNKTTSGTVNATSSLTRSTSRTITAQVRATGSAIKQTARTFTANITAAATVLYSKLFTKTLTATVNILSSIIRQTGKNTTGTVNTSSSITRQTSKTLTGTVTTSGSLTRQTNKILSAAVSIGSSVERLTARALTALVSITGTFTAQIAAGAQTFYKTLEAAISATGSLVRSTSRTFSAAVTASGAAVKQTGKTTVANITASSAIARQVGKVTSAIVNASGSIHRATSRTITAVVSIAGEANKLTSRTFTAAVNIAGEAIALFKIIYYKTLTATVSISADITDTFIKRYHSLIQLIATFNPVARLTALFNGGSAQTAVFDDKSDQTAVMDSTINYTVTFNPGRSIMASSNGSTITIYQGETLDIAFAIVDGDGVAYNLTGGKAVLTYQKSGETAVNLECTIATTTATAAFTHATTQLMSGNYRYQLMCRNSTNQIVMTKDGIISVKETINPDAAN